MARLGQAQRLPDQIVGAQDLGLKECAALVAEMLSARGFDVRIMATAGAPDRFQMFVLLPLERGAEAYATFKDKRDRCTKVVLRPGTA